MKYKSSLLLILFILFAYSLPGQAEPEIRSAYDYVRDNGYVKFPSKPPTVNPSPGPRAWDYQVGDSRSFWTWDLSQMPPRDVQVPATCRAIGPNTYVFVADDQWDSNVDQTAVDTVLNALETATPASSINPAQGIVPNEIQVFGAIPDVHDDDPRVFVLLMELQSFGGTQFDGFFNAFNQYTDAQAMAEAGYHSNEIEMVTVNSAIRAVDTETTLSIVAHELQHLIHWGGDQSEVSWVNESCSEAAMVLNGYDTEGAWIADYLHAPQSALYETEHVHYGACLLFGAYLYERFGAGFLTTLVSDSAQGEAGFAASLAALEDPLTMDELLLDWATATMGDSLGASDERYSHPLLDLNPPNMAERISSYPHERPAANLSNTGTAYLRLDKPGQDVELEIAVTPLDSLLAQVLVVEPDGTSWIGQFSDSKLIIPFTQLSTDAAYLVLLAQPDQNVQYSLSANTVTIDPDGGSDGDTDGGLDGGEDGGPDGGDSGSDGSSPCPSGEEQVVYEGQTICVPICKSGQNLIHQGGSWVCSDDSGGCNCASDAIPAYPALLLSILLASWFMRRRL